MALHIETQFIPFNCNLVTHYENRLLFILSLLMAIELFSMLCY